MSSSCGAFVPSPFGTSSSGGGTSGVDVEDEGVPLVDNPYTTLNFVGAGVTATDVGGVATITIPGASGSGIAALPEQWCQNDVAASQTNVSLSAQVSTNFDTLKMIRAGSIVGIATRFSGTVTAGQATVTITKNGAAGTLNVVSTSASNQNGGVAVQATGIDTYVAGDLIGVQITTNAGFLPVTTDVEAWLQVQE